ncbi:MAG: hypothetical protein A2722_01765 [Candidatus Doudnabacteria bacterium RIFCSPHIGHO2_01_FULL_50_11]|uniref:Amidohydrolase-related domain-containing protein n=1 Tax=Candidatus Doudnabacteria bacterium RIFCSPHIGHO2_01_FULL_50_11 TaxID=1817828 RepID=A0A1F5PMM3_9BACT|nr:MAG: hypothetical protein A2722_01765 [Candidatus Doudnabacteria bacterium RIFCSPHIGHO2_01_FULL_50_11]HLC44681.1 dihydroorotase family protein [Patescibacteria group bacterium]
MNQMTDATWEIRDVLLPTGVRATIRIQGKKIVAVGFTSLCDRYLDGSNLEIYPGFRNVHVHFRQPGWEYKETWATAVPAAIAGGYTLVCSMPNAKIQTTTLQALEDKIILVGDQPIDKRFWYGATKTNHADYKYLRSYAQCCGVKLYTSSTTGDMKIVEREIQRYVMATCADARVLLAIHAQDEELRLRNLTRLQAQRELVIADHCKIQDTEVELRAVIQALELQKETRCAILLCHLSAPESLEAVDRARQAGQTGIYVETCPQYLFLNSDFLKGEFAAGFKCNPSLRSRKQMKRMFELTCRPDIVDVISDDHAPHNLGQDKGIVRLRPLEISPRPYDEVASGLPGLQTTGLLVYNSMVASGKVSRFHFANLMSINAGRILGLPRPGIDVGADADLVAIDPQARHVFRHYEMLSKAGYTPYDGFEGSGRIAFTVAQGALYGAELK